MKEMLKDLLIGSHHSSPWELVVKHVLDSGVVAGITALTLMSTQGSVPVKTVLVAFGLSFLLEMRKYLHLIYPSNNQKKKE